MRLQSRFREGKFNRKSENMLEIDYKTIFCQVAQCSQYQFQCRSGECIATYDTCNGIPQCTDASDEDPGLCPPQTTSSPAGHLHLRPDMDPPQQQRQQQHQSYWSQQQLPVGCHHCTMGSVLVVGGHENEYFSHYFTIWKKNLVCQ